jgi:hypothetical protein
MTKKQIDFDDFIDPDIEIETGIAINPKAKLMNFAKIKVAAIDPKIHKEISESMQRIRANLQRLKSLVKE